MRLFLIINCSFLVVVLPFLPFLILVVLVSFVFGPWLSDTNKYLFYLFNFIYLFTYSRLSVDNADLTLMFWLITVLLYALFYCLFW